MKEARCERVRDCMSVWTGQTDAMVTEISRLVTFEEAAWGRGFWESSNVNFLMVTSVHILSQSSSLKWAIRALHSLNRNEASPLPPRRCQLKIWEQGGWQGLRIKLSSLSRLIECQELCVSIPCHFVISSRWPWSLLLHVWKLRCREIK